MTTLTALQTALMEQATERAGALLPAPEAPKKHRPEEIVA
jgi:hypothetical protein